MYYLAGAKPCFQTLLRLVCVPGEQLPGIDCLRSRYIDFCEEVGGWAVRPRIGENQVTNDEGRISAIIDKYRDKSALTDITASILDTPHSSRVEAMERVSVAKGKFYHTDPAFIKFFNFFIHTLFYQRAYHSGGGSVSSALGVIWCAVNRKWSDVDINEFLVHELTHNLLFLDERAYTHYKSIDAIADQKNWAVSTILERPRPLDKVFHSLVVGHEVLSYRKKHGEPSSPKLHPSTSHMLLAATRTIESLKHVLSEKDIVTERFLDLFKKVSLSIEAMAKHESDLNLVA